MASLSVVTPSLNQAAFIQEALDSVAALRVPHEHVVMDGGSTDGTVDLLRARDDDSLRWTSEADRGQTHAVNKGFAAATGDYLGWINADDAYVPGAVERAVSHLDSHPDVAAVYGGLDIVDEDGAVVRNYRPAPFNWRRYVYLGDYVPTPAIIFRRSLLSEVALLDERYRDAADYDFYLRLLHRRRVDRMPESITRFRYHDASKTASDPGLGMTEALAIRLCWARHPRDRAVMRALDAAKRLLFRFVPPWPPGRLVTHAADRAYALREQLSHDERLPDSAVR